MLGATSMIVDFGEHVAQCVLGTDSSSAKSIMERRGAGRVRQLRDLEASDTQEGTWTSRRLAWPPWCERDVCVELLAEGARGARISAGNAHVYFFSCGQSDNDLATKALNHGMREPVDDSLDVAILVVILVAMGNVEVGGLSESPQT